jgi:outer membrane protein TolC
VIKMRFKPKLFVPLAVLQLCAQADLSLPEAAARAVASHPSVGARQAAGRVAAAGIEEARAARWFRVDYSESFTRSDNPVFVFGALLTQRQFTSQNFGLDALNRPDFLNNFQSLVRVEQPLWDAGRSRHAATAAKANAEAVKSAVELTRLDLVARTARAYMDVNLTSEAIAVAEQAVKSAEADRDRAVALRDAGRATDGDVFSVEVQLAQMREHLIARRSERSLAVASLNEAIGAPLDTDYKFTTRLAALPAATPAKADRPETVIAGFERQAAEARLHGAQAALLPQVVFRGAFEADRQRFVTRAGANWTAEVALRWSLFDGGANRSRIRQASASVEAAQAAERTTVSRVALEVFQSGEMVKSAEARFEATGAAVAMSAESLRVTQNRYSAGLATVTDLLRAQTASLEAQLRRLSAAHALRLAQFQRFAAAGQLTANSEVLQ